MVLIVIKPKSSDGITEPAPVSESAADLEDGSDNLLTETDNVLDDKIDDLRPALAKEPVPYGQIQKDDSDVKKYLKLRTVNSLEAVMLNLGIPQVDCSREFVFLPVDLDPITRVVKRAQHRSQLEGQSDDIYYDNRLEKYFQRSDELEAVTYPDYHEPVTEAF